MLSKSQSRAFFLGGTLVTFLVFIGLTIYSFMPKNDQTNKEKINPQVVKGKEIWESNNCMGCHTILGEGAYYAPELTKVYDRRGEAFIKAMLKDPEKMYPGQRKMYNYKFTDEEIASLTAFLKWIGEVDTNGFPAKPDLMKVASPNAQNSDPNITVVENNNRPIQEFNNRPLIEDSTP